MELNFFAQESNGNRFNKSRINILQGYLSEINKFSRSLFNHYPAYTLQTSLKTIFQQIFFTPVPTETMEKYWKIQTNLNQLENGYRFAQVFLLAHRFNPRDVEPHKPRNPISQLSDRLVKSNILSFFSAHELPSYLRVSKSFFRLCSETLQSKFPIERKVKPQIHQLQFLQQPFSIDFQAVISTDRFVTVINTEGQKFLLLSTAAGETISRQEVNYHGKFYEAIFVWDRIIFKCVDQGQDNITTSTIIWDHTNNVIKIINHNQEAIAKIGNIEKLFLSLESCLIVDKDIYLLCKSADPRCKVMRIFNQNDWINLCSGNLLATPKKLKIEITDPNEIPEFITCDNKSVYALRDRTQIYHCNEEQNRMVFELKDPAGLEKIYKILLRTHREIICLSSDLVFTYVSLITVNSLKEANENPSKGDAKENIGNGDAKLSVGMRLKKKMASKGNIKENARNLISRSPGQYQSCSFSPNKKYVAILTGGAINKIYVFDVNNLIIAYSTERSIQEKIIDIGWTATQELFILKENNRFIEIIPFLDTQPENVQRHRAVTGM